MDNRIINWLIWNKCSFDRGCLLCFALSILGLQVGGLLQDQYIGCFDYSNETTLVTANSNLPDYQLTIDKCILKCGTKTYAALQNGTMCLCVNDYGIQQRDDVCNIVCAGNQLEYCGGATVSVVYAVCPVGSYGYACDEFCHCKRQIPCDRLTGNCPKGCDGNYTGPSCDKTSLREQYIGCYKDFTINRSLPYAAHRESNYRYQSNTIENCRFTCADANFSFAGAQFSSECFCGENYNKHGEFEGARCNSNCSGDRRTICGGPGANSVYSVCPFGRYGKGCREKCNCLNNTRCIYLNGSCPLSQCKPGWAGTSCNIRDCRAYNGNCHQNETCSTVDLKFSNLSLCRCSEGFQRRKIWENCTDKDECSEKSSVCGQNALNCTNTIGGYQCLCPNCQTMINTACFEAMESNNIWPIVGPVLGSLLSVTVVLLVVVVVHLLRLKRQYNKSTTPTSENVRKFDEPATRGTKSTEERTYEMLNRIPDEPNVYEQIAVTSSEK